MLRILIILITSILLAYPQVRAQEDKMTVSGTVYDSTGTVPLSDALAYGVSIADSSLIGYARSNENGFFELNPFEIDTLLLWVMYPGMKDQEFFVVGNPEQTNINLGKIKMRLPRANELDEVVILGYKEPIYFVKDTLIFVADSFRLKQNAVVEDLLKKLPGVNVNSDGKISVNGDKVDRLFVDGDEFFGNDPSIALKNLDAKAIDRVKVYEKENDLSNSEDKENIVDLTLKEEARKNYFGRISAGSDFVQYHTGELLFNRFNGNRKYSIYTLGSTTPKSQFTSEEIQKYGLDNEMSYSFGDDGSIDIDLKDPYSSAGIPRTLSTGAYFSDKFGIEDQIKLTANYSFSRFEFNSFATSNSTYLLSDSVYYSDDSISNKYINYNHRFNVVYEHDLDSLKKLINRTFVKLNTNDTETKTENIFLNQELQKALKSSFASNQNATNNSLRNILFLGIQFPKPKRLFTIQHNISLKKQLGAAQLTNGNLYYLPSFGTDTLSQSRNILTNTLSNQVRVRWIEPIGLFKLKLTANGSVSSSRNENLAFDDLVSNETIDTNFSSLFETLQLEGYFEPTFEYKTRAILASMGAKFLSSQLNYQENFTAIDGTYNRNVVLPNFQLRIKPASFYRLDLNYFTASKLPSSQDLQPLLNNANPNFIRLGNQDLVANYSHNFRLRSKLWSFSKGHSLSASALLKFISNDFGTSSSTDQLGRIINQTINVSGNRSFSANILSNLNLYKKKIYLHPEASIGQLVDNNSINNLTNQTVTTSYSGLINLQLNFDSLVFSIGAGGEYSLPQNSLFPDISAPYFTIGSEAEIEWYPISRLGITSDVSYRQIRNNTSDFSAQYMVWNAAILYNFLAKENLTLSFNAFDILNQNIAIQQIVVGNTITDNTTKVVSRYFQLKLNYRFSGNPEKKVP